jgi:hypothetical protein
MVRLSAGCCDHQDSQQSIVSTCQMERRAVDVPRFALLLTSMCKHEIVSKFLVESPYSPRPALCGFSLSVIKACQFKFVEVRHQKSE